MSVITKGELHRLVEALPENRLDAAKRLLATLFADDPVGLALALAPTDDEPETDEERALVAEAKAELERGERIPAAEIYREFGV